jgi:hypothetical protein
MTAEIAVTSETNFKVSQLDKGLVHVDASIAQIFDGY